jgi:protocatechuate 4,5-dioxygenase alpha chain
MSSHAIEKALWQAVTNPADGDRLRGDAAAYLLEFRLTDEERDLVLGWDVKALAERRVNELLLMMAFSATHGMDQLPVYLGRING